MNEWANKKVVVVGLGVSNLALIRFLVKHQAVVSARDRKTSAELGQTYQALQEIGVEFQLGEDYLQGLDNFDTVFLTPGIPKHLPEIHALKDKVPVLSEIALVLRYAKAPVYAITGSSGKTTTTSLVAKMLEASGKKCFIGGNIGTPLIEQVMDIPSDVCIIMELSSFQLELLDQSPEVALITNVTENHLDIHLTMDNYITAKKQIYAHQDQTNICILNYDDPLTVAMSDQVVGQLFWFSMKTAVENGAYLDGDRLVFQDKTGIVEIVKKTEIALLGEHNVANILAAAVLAHLAGASWTAISHAAKTFTGVTHRLEKVAIVDQVTYYNDSIATSPSRSIAGILAFSQPVILIAGGYDKKLSFTEFAKIASQRLEAIILFGQTAHQIQVAMEVHGFSKIHIVNDLEQAVKLAHQLASAGDVVLLSPASASYDMYPNFEVRGEHFRHAVGELTTNM